MRHIGVMQDKVPQSLLSDAWLEAVSIFRREGQLIIPVAIALFALPLLVLLLFVTPPAPGTVPQPTGSAFLPLLFVPFVLVGALTISTLTLQTGVSVGEALKQAVRRLPALLGAVALLWLVLLVVVFVATLFIVARSSTEISPQTVQAVQLVLTPVFLFLLVRFSLLNAVTAAEHGKVRTMLRRSWRLTKGRFWRLFALHILGGLLTFVTLLASTLALGVLLALLMPAPLARDITDVVHALLLAVWLAFYFTVLARIYARLAGGATSGI